MPSITLQRSGSGELELKITVTKEAVDMLLQFFVEAVKENEEESTKEEVREMAKNLLANSLGKPVNNNSNNNYIAKDIDNGNGNSEVPSLEEVQEYARERDSCVNCEKFFKYYSARNWKDKSGKPLADWKNMFQSWERTEFNQTYKQPVKPQKREFTPTEF